MVTSTSTNTNGLHLRPARWSDALFLYRLASDTEVRANSLDQRPPTPSRHLRWMKRMLSNPEARLLIVGIHGRRAGVISGQIHYRMGDQNKRAVRCATVGVSLHRDFRGLGNGTPVIREGSDKLALDMICERLTAVIRDDNYPSLKSFNAAGYRKVMTGTDTLISRRGDVSTVPVVVMEKHYPWRK